MKEKTERKRNYKGEGTVYYSKTQNRWVAQFYDENTGMRHTVSDVDEGKLKKKLLNAKIAAATGKYTKRSNITIAELGKEVIDLKYESNVITANTYKRDIDTLNVIKNSELGSICITKVTRMQIQDFFNHQKSYSNSVIKMLYQMLSQIFNEAIQRNLLIKNPLQAVIKPKSDKQTKKIRALTVEEHKIFVNSLELQNSPRKNELLTLINTGMRAGECLAIRAEDIDFKRGICTVRGTISRNENGKSVYKPSAKTINGQNREIPCDDNQIEVFKSALQNFTFNQNHLVFTYQGEMLATTYLNATFKRIISNLRKAALKKDPTSTLFKSGESGGYLSLHSLRHTFATRCIEAGMPAHVLQKILGHSDVSITLNTYTDIFQKYKDEEWKKVLDYKKSNNL